MYLPENQSSALSKYFIAVTDLYVSEFIGTQMFNELMDVVIEEIRGMQDAPTMQEGK